MASQGDKFSFNFIAKALGHKPTDPEPQVKPENDPMSPAYVVKDAWTGQEGGND